jgi:hypothetical protein
MQACGVERQEFRNSRQHIRNLPVGGVLKMSVEPGDMSDSKMAVRHAVLNSRTRSLKATTQCRDCLGLSLPGADNEALDVQKHVSRSRIHNPA